MAQGALCRERSLWDTGRPPRVSSLTQALRGSTWADSRSPEFRGTINKQSTASSTGAGKEEPWASLSEATRGPGVAERQTDLQGPQNEATDSLTRSAADVGVAEAESHSNLATHTLPLYEQHSVQSSTHRSFIFSVIFGLQSDETKPVSVQSKVSSLREWYEKEAKHRVIPCRERSITWYVMDGTITDNLENETVSKHFPVLYKIYRWLNTARFLPKTDNVLEMAVVLEGYPYTTLTKPQAEELCKRINLHNKSYPFLFNAIRCEKGAVIFTCRNEATKIWLKDTIPKLNAWLGDNLEVGPADIVEHGIKFSFDLSIATVGMLTSQILHFLEVHNWGLSTKEWTVVERTEATEHSSLTVWVDNQSLNFLRKRYLRLRLLGFYIKFKPLLNINKTKLAEPHIERTVEPIKFDALQCVNANRVFQIETRITEGNLPDLLPGTRGTHGTQVSQATKLAVAKPIQPTGKMSSLSQMLQRISKPHCSVESDKGRREDLEPLTTDGTRFQDSSLSQFLERVSKPCNSTGPDEGRWADLKPPTTGETQFQGSSLSQFLERVSKPCSSVESNNGRRGDLEPPTAAGTMFQGSSLSQLLETVSKPCGSMESIIGKHVGLEPPTAGEIRFQGSSLSQFLETVSKPLGSTESHKRRFADLEPQTADDESFKNSKISHIYGRIKHK